MDKTQSDECVALHAHRIVLAAASPVLAAFETDHLLELLMNVDQGRDMMRYIYGVPMHLSFDRLLMLWSR